MNQTHGFIEIWLAQILNIEYMEYGLENGSVAAAVDQDGFDAAFDTVVYIWNKLDKNEAFKPAVMDSIIHGMRIAIHKYWANDDLLNDLTGESAKATDIYLNVIAMGPSGVRFALDAIKDDINNRNSTTPEEPQNGAIPVENEVLEEKVIKPVKKSKALPRWIARMNKVSKSISSVADDASRYHDVTLDEDCVRVIVYSSNISTEKLDKIVDMAKRTKKSIICLHGSGHASNVLEVLKKDYNMADLSKYVLFFVYALPSSKFTLNENTKAVCFGYEIDEMYSISGADDQNTSINKIRGSSSLSDEKKEEKINVILKERKNSPVYKYDAIYKDTVTNVIWAAKDRCVVYFLVPYPTGKNKNFFKIAHEEFINRYLNTLPYNELVKIDRAYMEKRHANNKEDYVKFAIASSRVITDQIKKKMNEHQDKYKEHLAQAMEHAKMFQRFHDQIAYFNEGDFMEDERKKANDNYESTMAIDKISTITVKDNTVHVYTHNIYAQDERTKRWHDIGTFHITVGMHSNAYDQSKTVRIKNTKHQIEISGSYMNAPHVWQGGNICHGNLASGMTDAYKRRNLFELIYQIILFIESANTSDSAGEKVNRWPEVPEEVALSISQDADTLCEVMAEINEVEKKFDDNLADAIPIHIN